ncbi:MAG: EamA family transporter [Acidobacteria bacterium]|nr:EamA family transporter [Acidobacteriota bacterium]NIM61622.1 EamA family transporter [Acidobacteriota bacterium]NIO58886.1 EamA family transporter [Acidobacteriota bacterium]NIQ29937.1 EamA family transporter [Acidobacteriota bacterium]NIQ87430.1 EamA family transporter [Acidobacteriota bacterium]
MTRSNAVPRLQILAAALLFSTGGAVIKTVSLDGWQTAAVRSTIAGFALLLFMPAWRRAWTYRTLLVGLAYGSTMVLFVLGNKLTTSANIIFLQTTAPLYILLIGPLLLREKIRPREVAVAAALAVGLVLFFVGYESPQETAPDPHLGNVLGAFAGLSWALTLAGLRWLGRTPVAARIDPAGGAVVVGNLVVGLVCLPLALPFGSSTPTDWLFTAYLGLFQIGLAYVFMTRGVRGVSALEASLLLILEPVAGVFWTWLVHGERPLGWSLAGCLVILVATVANTLASRRGDAVLGVRS